MSYSPELIVLFIILMFLGFLRVRDKKAQVSHRPDVDQLMLDKLEQAGDDLTQPRTLEFVLYCPTQESARKAAEQVRGDGFEVSVRPSARSSDWLCLAIRRMVPEPGALSLVRTRLDRLAESVGGEYDGWRTPVGSDE